MKNEIKILKQIITTILLLVTVVSYSQTKSERNEITKNYDLQKLEALSAKFYKQQKADKEEAIRLAEINNWKVTFEKNGVYYSLQRVSKEGKPVYYRTCNADAAISTRANHLHNAGSLGLNLEGQNMTAYIWEFASAQQTHQEYDDSSGNDRVTVIDTQMPPFYHATHVVGTILALGVKPEAKGMAPQATGFVYDWDNDIAEATNEAMNGMLISNHSYHSDPELIEDWEFGAYTNVSRDWDIIMNNAPYYLMVAGAGNDGDNELLNGLPLEENSGYDKLTGDISTPKNGLIVAASEDANIAPDGTLIGVVICDFSSQGPTDDYRIKPDITGNGYNLFSPSTGYNDSTYFIASGTSMSSPNVAGSLLLLQQHYNQTNGNFMKAATLKSLTLHTADDTETNGPDAVWGWGQLNAKRAAETISNDGTESLIIESSLEEGETYTLTVYSDNINPLLASICWNDPAGIANTGIANDPTPVLVNDLDIRVSNDTEYFPWKLTSITTNAQEDNIVDPFERVDVMTANGTYTITVTHKGTLTNGSQDFSLIVTGITGSSAFTCNAGENNYACQDEPFTTQGTGANISEIEWTTNGDGSFAPYNNQFNSTYIAGTQDIENGGCTLTISVIGTGGGTASDDMYLNIVESPICSAGSDDIVSENQSYTMQGVATHAGEITWTTDGDGTFDDNSILDAIYTCGPNDIANGGVNLNLHVEPISPCEGADDDEMHLGITTGVVDIDNSFTGLFLYPNPSTGTINISFDLPNSQDVKIELYNIIGELLDSKAYRNESGSFNKNINFSNLTKGMYFIKINSGNSKSVKKIIIK